MKFLMLALLAFVVFYTFNLSQEKRITPIQVHAQIVDELKSAMSDYLKNNSPDIKNIEFIKSTTEVLKPGALLKAYFKYSFDTPSKDGSSARETREGEFLLSSDDKGETWEPKGQNFKSLELEFLEELVISPKKSISE